MTANAKCASHFQINLAMGHYKLTHPAIFVVTALILAVSLLACGWQRSPSSKNRTTRQGFPETK